MKSGLLVFFIFLINISLHGQNWSDKASVKIWAETSVSPPKITLRWVLDPDALNYIVYRKTKTAKTWGPILATLPKDSSSFIDNNVETGETYEYRINRTGGAIAGSGYLFAGIRAEPYHWRGTVLILIDSLINARLKNEIEVWKNDVSNEGWYVISFVPGGAMKVSDIKERIKNFKVSYPDLRSVFILGHVKVPYSGNIAPDGHSPDHVGAWPADNYYGDLDGNWTDVSVNNAGANRTENKNVPGDGKFDQDQIPSDLELEIGRVDFSNMPIFTIGEVELTRRYLNKNHLFRINQIKSQRKALVVDNFNFQNEAFGQSGYKNFSALIGPQNIEEGGYRDSLRKKSYLLSYGAGPGSYESAGGISTSQNMVSDSLRGIFTFLFGSYFGDWDSRNNFLRAALGSGTILTNAWAGRPIWYIHHMGLGENIGYGMRTSINNTSTNNTYVTGFGSRGVHAALMGDPTLILHPLDPPSKLEATEAGSHVDLKWLASADAGEGYNIYKRIAGNSVYELLASNVKELKYRDLCVARGFTYNYMVRAVKLEATASGTYLNLSPGIQDTLAPLLNTMPVADFTFNSDYEFVKLKSISRNAGSFKWVIGKDTFKSTELDIQLSCDSLTHTVCLIAEGECESDIKCKEIRISCSIPEVNMSSINHPKCFGGTGSIKILDVLGADPFTYNWNTGLKQADLIDVPAGKYTLTITSSKSTSKSFEFEIKSPDEIKVNYIIKPAAPTKNNGGLENLTVSGGVPPYTLIGPPGKIDSLPAGDYTLVVTDANGCIKEIMFRVPVNTNTLNESGKSILYVSPNPVSDILHIQCLSDVLIYDLQLFDQMGHSIFRSQKHQSSINVRSLAPGTYQLKCHTNKGPAMIGFIKI